MTEHPHEHICVCSFSADERRVIRFLTARIDNARGQYGPLSVDDDPRDFAWERALEGADWVLYDVMRELRRRTNPQPDRKSSDE